ncbi:hypothetical protein N7508_002531 [Penicillium antarcticum]|uniref:uncharacterized protein n=1 Tax=Penicillium antarcticum TaxID=416450 RepID=UPI00238651F4|nr:uncharacterized protein N7508_002531 [Penicillium antarcticum]KAJ5318023.1 hypothetical protein N7508_002531 [Penicillium antarcticum]
MTSSASASATKIHLVPATDSGVFNAGVREDTARVTSELLQDDMEKHHVFFNDMGFHNHIPHHLLSIYALGASPEHIKNAYNQNVSYQRPAKPVDPGVVQSMCEVDGFRAGLGMEKNYSNYLAFFQGEIDAKGVGDVLAEYLFAGDERAENMLCRLFGGLIHPLIHLCFGLEFNQPAIVAQGLAQAAVHDDWLGRAFFLPAEKMSAGVGVAGKKSLLELLNECRAEKTLVDSVKWADSNKIKDGVMTRAPEQMLKIAAQFTVSEDQVEERLADMINTVVYYTSAAQRSTREMRLDFFFIHCVNSSIFLSKIVNLPYLGQRSKLRLMEWKGRIDLLMYVSRGTPELFVDEVAKYPIKEDWPQIFERAVSHSTDDGHLAKLARAVAHGQRVCQGIENKMPINGDMWLRIGNIAVDSTVGEGQNGMWIRSTGFDEAWESQGHDHM